MASIEQKEIWNNQYKTRRQKLIDDYGVEYVRNLENERKRVQRAQKKHAVISNSMNVDKLLNNMTNDIKDYTKKIIEDSNDKKFIKIKSDIPKIVKKKQLLVMKKVNSMDQFVKMLPKDTLKNKGDPVGEHSLHQYADNIRKLYNSMFNKVLDFNDLSFLNNYEKIGEFLVDKYGTETNTTGTYINSITSILGRLSGYDDLYKAYSDMNIELKMKYDLQMGESQLSKKELLNYVDYDELLNFKPLDNPLNNLIYALYVYLPPRRNDDYKEMVVIHTKDVNKDQLKDDRNYYLSSTNEFVFKFYKTYKTYKDFIIDLNTSDTEFIKYSKVKEAIENYIKAYKIQNKGYLFTSSHSGFQLTNFTQKVNSVFKIGTKKIGANILRHAYVSNLLKKNATHNVKKTIALYMGHDVKTQSMYNRLQ